MRIPRTGPRDALGHQRVSFSPRLVRRSIGPSPPRGLRAQTGSSRERPRRRRPSGTSVARPRWREGKPRIGLGWARRPALAWARPPSPGARPSRAAFVSKAVPDGLVINDQGLSLAAVACRCDPAVAPKSDPPGRLFRSSLRRSPGTVVRRSSFVRVGAGARWRPSARAAPGPSGPRRRRRRSRCRRPGPPAARSSAA